MVRGKESLQQGLVINRCFSMTKPNSPLQTFKKRKRYRERNYTPFETQILIQLVMDKKNVINGKNTGAAAWREKELAWGTITDEFNTLCEAVFRDTKSLKTKYEGLKRDTKKKMFDGQLQKPLTSVETAICELIAMSPEEEGDSKLNNTENDIDASLQSQVEYSNIHGHQSSQCIKEEPIYGDEDMNREANSCHSGYEPPPLPNEDCGDPEIDNKEHKTKEEFLYPAELPRITHIKTEPEESNIKWNDRKYRPFTSRRPSGKQFQKRHQFERLIREKKIIAVRRRKILEEELQTKAIQRQMAAEELDHKRELFIMKKMKLQMQIELLKRKFEYPNGKLRIKNSRFCT